MSSGKSGEGTSARRENRAGRAGDSVCVGLPRALMYHKYGVLWERFFRELGCEVKVSLPTDRAIYEAGEAASIDESCLASKVFLGHVDWLLPRTDVIFVPAFITREHRRGFCTKHQSLPDLVRNTFGIDYITENRDARRPARGKEEPHIPAGEPNAPVGASTPTNDTCHSACGRLRPPDSRSPVETPSGAYYAAPHLPHLPHKASLLTCEVGSDFKRKDLAESYVQIARVLGKGPKQASRAFKAARAAQKAADMHLAESAQAILKSDAPIKVAIAAHPYIARDDYLAGALTRTLDAAGATYMQACDLPEKPAIEASFELTDTMPWAQNRHIAGALLQAKPHIDGIILVSAFPCGPDSLSCDLIARKLGDVPILKVVLDGQAGDAGLVTRIESFIDIIAFKARKGYLHE